VLRGTEDRRRVGCAPVILDAQGDQGWAAPFIGVEKRGARAMT
jgi:hypothetical protein